METERNERRKAGCKGKVRFAEDGNSCWTRAVPFVPRFVPLHEGCEKPGAGHARTSSAKRWGCPCAIQQCDPIENICPVSYTRRKPLSL